MKQTEQSLVERLREWAKVVEGIGGLNRSEVLLEAADALERQLAAPAELPPLTDEQIKQAVITACNEMYGEDDTKYTEEDADFYGKVFRALLAQRAAPTSQPNNERDIAQSLSGQLPADISWNLLRDAEVPTAQGSGNRSDGLTITPNTLGGFKGAFYVEHRRNPTEQEIWVAGVLSGISRAERAAAAPQEAPQQEPAEKFCDGNCTWLDHHPECDMAAPVSTISAKVPE